MDRLNSKDLSISQQTDNFMALFNKKKHDIENNILKAEQLDRDKLPSHFDLVNEDFQKLQKYLGDSTIFLPFYNVRTAQEALKWVQELIFATQDKLMPKKKFAFKKKTMGQLRPAKTASNDVMDAAQNKLKSDSTKEGYVNTNQRGFNDCANQILELGEDVNIKDVELSKLDDCTVKILGAPSTLHLSNLNQCRIFVGPVTTSVFIENCVDCIFSVACQQLRIHSTKNCDFYLHVTSRAIIEDSVKVRFAPYNWNYEALDAHYEISGLDREKNNWDLVDDFNWLSSDMHSPNWSVLEEDNRQSFVN